LSDVSFAIEPGEIVGQLGPNGSGKSTIFRFAQLAGYLPLRRTSSHLTARGNIVIMLSPFWVELRAIAPGRRGQRSSSGRPMYERDGQIQTAFLDHILGSRCIE
jgi:energy-coupling factor transporter ATP-binding protein EcfA2